MRRFSSLFLGIIICFALIVPSKVEGYYTNMPASVVIGQPDFTSSSANQGRGIEANNIAANLLANPHGVFVVGNKLIISDYSNHRVLIYNSIPTSNNASADVVIGQQNFTSNSENQGGTCAANTLRGVHSVFSDGSKLFIVDVNNHRVLIFNSIPTTNNASADVVIGQVDFTHCTANQGGSANANTLSTPVDVKLDGTKLLIVDELNHRVLIYNSIPTSNNASANVVVGQTNFTNASANQGGSVNANTLNGPLAAAVYNGKLFVSDGSNARVLIYNSIPTSNNASADVVVGQADFTSNSYNQGGSPAANTLYKDPRFIWANNNRLFIPEEASAGSNRVLIFNSIPTSNNASADIVIGQPNFTSSSANQGGSPAANTLRRPSAVWSDNQKMIISDRINSRILIFPNTINTPSLGISSITGIPNSIASADQGKLRLTGNISIDGGLYNIWKVEASVNGGGYTPVTSLSNSTSTNSTHDPGKDDTVASTFSHDFEPWNWKGQSEGNGTKQDWIDNQKDMLSSRGYTIKLKGYNNNTDTNDALFYFTPFILRQSSGSSTLSTTPTISFSVNTYQRQELKENLDHYEIWTKLISSKDPVNSSNWEKYIDGIPVDYDTVKGYDDNLRKNQTEGTTTDGNGTYENNNLLVTFSINSSTISVRKKGSQEGTLRLRSGQAYQFKVSAIDKSHHTQDTDTITVTIKGSPNNKNNLPLTTEWFPLQINSIQGSTTGFLSSMNPTSILPSYITSSTVPTIHGIAFSNTTITLTVTDTTTEEQRTYQTTTDNDSTWTLTPTLYSSSQIDVSVESIDGKYMELPTFILTTATSQTTDVQGVTDQKEEGEETKLEETVLPQPSPTPETAPSKRCVLWWCW